MIINKSHLSVSLFIQTKTVKMKSTAILFVLLLSLMFVALEVQASRRRVLEDYEAENYHPKRYNQKALRRQNWNNKNWVDGWVD
jgi:hypothetical protein